LAILRELPEGEVQQRELSLSLYNIGTLQETAGELDDALESLREAEQIHAPLGKYQKEHHFWTKVYERVLGEVGAQVSYDHLTLAYAAIRKENFVGAVKEFDRALADAALRSDLKRGHLYNAACVAALAKQSDRALKWLEEDLAMRRKHSDPKALQHHLMHARDQDSDLKSLRALPAFRKLFEE